MDPFNFADALVGVLSQRLARKLCLKCKRSHPCSDLEISELLDEYCAGTDLDRTALLDQWRKDFAIDGVLVLYEAVGCEACRGGYKGRVGVYELLSGTAEVKQLVRSRGTVPQVVAAARAGGMRLLRQDAIEQTLRGILDRTSARSCQASGYPAYRRRAAASGVERAGAGNFNLSPLDGYNPLGSPAPLARNFSFRPADLWLDTHLSTTVKDAMTEDDRFLGMHRDISRRDFVNGVAVAAAGLVVGGLGPPGSLQARAADATDGSLDPYPPRRMGMRGSHPGSFESAHALRDEKALDLAGARETGETYDLIVVGGGLSGLSAAHYFRKSVGAAARVLVLDNHDDFGGHAKRNELSIDGRTVAINGGTLEIESPGRYNKYALELLADIGVDLARYTRANADNRKLYESLGMRSGYFFEKETFGTDRLVAAPPHRSGDAERRVFTPEYLQYMPITERAKKDLLRLQDPAQPDYYLAGLTSAQKKERLAKISYKDFLLDVAKADPQAYGFIWRLDGAYSVSARTPPGPVRLANG